MAAGFEFFSSDDVGAPILHGAAGRLIAVLDWVLVSKGGWAKEFSGTNLAVYRSGTGNRFRLRVDDTQALYSRTRAYRAMTGVSIGTNQFPASAQVTNINTWGVRKAYDASGSSDPQRYWGIRTNRYLVLVVEGVSLTDEPSVGLRYRNWLVFGDVPSLCEGDSHNTIICAQPNVDSQYYVDWLTNSLYPQGIYPGHGYSTTQAGAAFSGTPNGAVVSPLSGVHWPYYNNATDAMKSAIALSDRMFFAPLIAGSTNSATANNGAFPRAMIPNVQALYGPCSSASDLQLPAQDLVPITIGSREFLPIMRYANTAGSYVTEALLLEKTDTDGAL